MARWKRVSMFFVCLPISRQSVPVIFSCGRLYLCWQAVRTLDFCAGNVEMMPALRLVVLVHERYDSHNVLLSKVWIVLGEVGVRFDKMTA